MRKRQRKKNYYKLIIQAEQMIDDDTPYFVSPFHFRRRWDETDDEFRKRIKKCLIS